MLLAQDVEDEPDDDVLPNYMRAGQVRPHKGCEAEGSLRDAWGAGCPRPGRTNPVTSSCFTAYA